MADDELATKAPESDAPQAPSAISAADTQAQQGPSMGEHCTTDRPTPPSSANPAGSISQINSIDCYVSKPPSYPQSPAKLLLLLTGGTGIHSTNNQLQADKWAENGFVVVMPDQFNKDSAPTTATTGPDDIDPGLLEQVKMRTAETVKSFLIDMWLARHTPEKVMPILHKALQGAKDEFADAVANGGGVYSAGYCFGAKYVLLLAAEQSSTAGQTEAGGDLEAGPAKRDPEIKAGALAHGTLVTKEDIEGARVPLCMVCVQNDSLFPDEVREQGRAALELNAVEHEISVYEDLPHGFAVLGDYEEAHIKEQQGKAFEQMVGWLKAH